MIIYGALIVGLIVGYWLGTGRQWKASRLRVENKLLEHEVSDYKALTDALKLEVRLVHDALIAAETMNATQRDVIEHYISIEEIARQQSARLEAVRETAAAVRDGCIEWERGQQHAFYIEE